MKKSARVSEKLVNLGLPGLQVTVRLKAVIKCANMADKTKRTSTEDFISLSLQLY